MTQQIGNIGNYYGCLEIKEDDGKFFWGIENWNGTNWEEIPESLFMALKEYEKTRDKSKDSY